MSKAGFNTAKNRLEQAKEDILWALDVLNGPDTALQQYKLTKKEKKELLQVFRDGLATLQIVLESRPSQKVSIIVESNDVDLGSIQLEDLALTLEGSLKLESTTLNVAKSDLEAEEIPSWPDRPDVSGRETEIPPWKQKPPFTE